MTAWLPPLLILAAGATAVLGLLAALSRLLNRPACGDHYETDPADVGLAILTPDDPRLPEQEN